MSETISSLSKTQDPNLFRRGHCLLTDAGSSSTRRAATGGIRESLLLGNAAEVAQWLLRYQDDTNFDYGSTGISCQGTGIDNSSDRVLIIKREE